MKSYEEIVEELGGPFEFVDCTYAWRAYKDGGYSVFSSKKSALEYSALVEVFIINKEEYDLNIASHIAFEVEVKCLWEDQLWVNTIGVPYSVFKLCLTKSYGDYGPHYSENAREIILDNFYTNIDFAKEILNSVHYIKTYV